jgi:protein associated with RNAse G/E
VLHESKLKRLYRRFGLALAGWWTVTGYDVRVVYTKYDGSLHWNQTMRYLGRDRHGAWLGAPAGMVARRGLDHAVVMEQAQVLLIPVAANFNAAPLSTEIYCDICTPPRWPGLAEVTMADLDLDVVRRRADQQVALLDEDEFAEHQVRYGYPAGVVEQARQAADWLGRALADGTQPFAGAYRDWLSQVA